MKQFNPEITKGPWHLVFGSSGGMDVKSPCLIIDSDGDSIAMLTINSSFKHQENLKVLAAVPEMLEVVKWAIQIFGQTLKMSDVLSTYDLEQPRDIKMMELALHNLIERHGVEENLC